MKLNKSAFSILSLLLIFVGQQHHHKPPAASAATPTLRDCEPKSCGNGLNISYPFWLRGKQPPYCGYPPLHITCRNGSYTPVLEIVKHDYYLLDVFYHNHSVLLTAVEFVDDPCPLPYANLTAHSSFYPLSVSPANRRVYFLLNCSSDLLDYKQVTCAESFGNLSAYFGGDYENTSGLDFADTGCVIGIVPVANYSAANIGNDGFDFVALLRRGWLLNWASPECEACTESGGRCGFNSTKGSFMCICHDRTHTTSCDVAEDKRKFFRGFVIALASAGSALLCLLLLFYILHCIKSQKDNNVQSVVEVFLRQQGSIAPKRYRYSEIKKMTNYFSDKLGQGGYGCVFKGALEDDRLVAVKVLSETKDDGEDFMNEVASISRTSHVNIVSLLGFCLEGSKRALVYEFMPNGSLEKFIYSADRPELKFDSKKLYKIALDIARGLEYLHGGCNTRIVHFDIKPHNILLDKDFCPKISDFGLAKLCPPQVSIISMVAARGTIGYIAPEVFSRNFGVVSSKSDVYSYGMMLLEMVGGRRNADASIENASQIYFPHWIYENLDVFCNLGIAGETSECKDTTRKMIVVGMWCIQMMPDNRPSICQVVEMLKGSTQGLQMPPKP